MISSAPHCCCASCSAAALDDALHLIAGGKPQMAQTVLEALRTRLLTGPLPEPRAELTRQHVWLRETFTAGRLDRSVIRGVGLSTCEVEWLLAGQLDLTPAAWRRLKRSATAEREETGRRGP
jgi:hypothetical protein